MNFIDRTLIRSVAANQVKLENQHGKVYSPDSVIDIWNTDYGLVSAANLPALQQQYGLEVAAERNASKATVPMSKIGVGELNLDALRGKLTIGPKDPGGAPAAPGAAIEA